MKIFIPLMCAIFMFLSFIWGIEMIRNGVTIDVIIGTIVLFLVFIFLFWVFFWIYESVFGM
jgi:hypothetical protein